MYFIKEINKVKKYLHINISANNLLRSAVISQVSLPQNLLTAKHSKKKKRKKRHAWGMERGFDMTGYLMQFYTD